MTSNDDNKTADLEKQSDSSALQVTPDTEQDNNPADSEDSADQSDIVENVSQLIMNPNLDTDWSKEIQSLFTDLAPVLCDSPDKCQLLILRLTLKDGSQYMVSGHGQRVARLPDGRTFPLMMHFVGQDEQDNGVAVAVKPQDILKVELVDLPDPDKRPSFGFARQIKDHITETTGITTIENHQNMVQNIQELT